MADKSSIEWTDSTWNPLAGCTKVSPGCAHCYAEKMAARLKAMGKPAYQNVVDDKGRWNSHIELIPSVLEQPLRWKRPRKIFVNSMSDLFHENVPDDYIRQVFEVMVKADWHIFQVLTKRADRMVSLLNRSAWWAGTIWEARKHIWLGVSVENQKAADERVPKLLNIEAIRFLSCEPLLGPVALDGGLNWDRQEYPSDRQIRWGHGGGIEGWNALTGEYRYYREYDGEPMVAWRENTIDWVIVGGESGPDARPMHPDWARSIRDQCQEAGTPFLFKQWGAWRSLERGESFSNTIMIRSSGEKIPLDQTVDPVQGDVVMVNVGKHVAGRLLDGREWNEYPIFENKENEHGREI